MHAEPGFTAAALDVETLEPGPWPVPGFRVDAERVTHTESSFGFRVSASDRRARAKAASSTPATAAWRPTSRLIRPGDTLLSEVSFGPGPVPGDAEHLDGPSVGALAARTGVGRVLLTHLQMGFDREATLASVREVFAGPVELVDPGFETEV